MNDAFKNYVLKAYWWNAVPNFGDAIAPLLLNHFLIEHFSKVKIEWDTVSRSSVASIGSILEHLPPLWDGYILGSGKLKEHSQLHNMSRAKVLAVRGPLSAKAFRGSIALGDPGLLANELVGHQEKKFDLGIVPHWKDTELVDRFSKIIKPPTSVLIISPREEPLTVLRKIGSCRRIVTSSLHGMIVADAFGGIPRRVELCAALDKEGGDFKFRDYSAAIKTPFEAGKMMEPRRFLVDDAKFAIYGAYQALAEQLKR